MSAERIDVYEGLTPLERGGPGQVYRARVVGGSPQDGDVALRVVTAQDAGGTEALDELMATHRLVREVDHNGLDPILDFGISERDGERRFWCATRYSPGRTVEQLVNEVGAFPDALTEAIAAGLAAAVQHLHLGGVHGLGVIPSRVYVREDSSVCVLDPGLGPAVRFATRFSAPDGELRLCAAPELLADDPYHVPASDLFAVGSVLYRCMTGTWWDRRDENSTRRPNEKRTAASAFLSEVVRALLEPEIDHRVDTSTDLVEILALRRDSAWWAEQDVPEEAQESRITPAELEKQKPRQPELEPPPIPAPASPPAEQWIEERRESAIGLGDHLAPCVGRNALLSQLLDRVDRVAQYDGEVLLLEGAAGTGKTRVLDEFVRRLRDRTDTVVLYGEHRRLGIGRPLQAFSEALTRYVNGSREVTSTEISPLLGSATAIAPAFAAFLSSLEVPEGSERLTPESLASAFARCLKTLSERRSLIFVIEDLQWADPEGLDLFGYLARLCETRQILLVASHRPAVSGSPFEALLAQLEAVPDVERIRIGGFTSDQTEEFVSAVVEPDDVAAVVATALHTASGGLPMHVVEGVGMLAAEGVLTPGDTRPLAGVAGTPIQVPRDLDEVLERRLRCLSETDRTLLEAAAVQGVAFDLEICRRVAGLSDSDAQEGAQRLAAIGIIGGDPPAWRFTSHALFTYLHNELSDEWITELHIGVAEAFQSSRNAADKSPDEVHGILAYRIAWHFLLAGDSARGLDWVEAAMRHLRDTWRLGDAERLADLACRAVREDKGDIGRYIDLLLQRTELLGLQGRRLEQREALDEALLRARKSGDKAREARTLLHSARLRIVIGQLKKARSEGRETLRLADESENLPVQARCHALLGSVAFRESRFQEARMHMQRVLELSREVRDAGSEAEALQTLGEISQGVGSWDHAAELQRAAMNLYRKSGDLAHEAAVLADLGTVATAVGEPVLAEQYLRRALAIQRSLGDGYGESRVLGLLGMLMQDTLRLGEAMSMQLSCLRVAREVGARQEELIAHINLATTQYLQGMLDDARDNYGDALRGAREVADRRLEGYALTGLGEVARQRGELDIAQGLLERAIKRLDPMGDSAGLGAALLALGRVDAFYGDAFDAKPALRRARELSRNPRIPAVLCVAAALLALLAAREGDEDEALRLLEASSNALVGEETSAFARIEMKFVESLVARVLKDTERANKCLLEAENTLQTTAKTLPEEHRWRFLTEVSPAREIVAGATVAKKSAAKD